MDDLGLSVDAVGVSSMFTGEEEVFAFARAVVSLSISLRYRCAKGGGADARDLNYPVENHGNGQRAVCTRGTHCQGD